MTRRMIITQAWCPRMPRVFLSRTPLLVFLCLPPPRPPDPATHISHWPLEAAHVSRPVSVHICLTSCPPPTPSQGHLPAPPYPSPAPSLEVPCLAGCVNMQWSPRAVQWRVCVCVCAVACPFLGLAGGPVAGPCRVKLVS